MEIRENRSLENIDGEIWKEIEGYDGDYFISNLGRVKSFKCGKEIILKPNKSSSGYFVVCLSKKGERPKTKQIHILVIENFIGKIPEGSVGHHIDENKKNNVSENFQIMTDKEHKKSHKPSEESKELMRGENNPNYGKHPSEETRKKQSEKKKGENNPNYGKHPSEETKELMREKMIGKYLGENNPSSTLTKQDVIEIRRLCDEGILTQKEIAKKFGVSEAQISKIKLRKCWKHININY